jgi:hypothetical protein
VHCRRHGRGRAVRDFLKQEWTVRIADGHTLLFQADGLSNAKLATPQLAYETSEFEIVTPLAQTNYALIVPAIRGWNRLGDLKGL